VDPFVRSFDPQCRSECIWRQPKIYVLRTRRTRRRHEEEDKEWHHQHQKRRLGEVEWGMEMMG